MPALPPERPGCPKAPGGRRPLPDAAAIQLFLVPESAPPYDEDVAAGETDGGRLPSRPPHGAQMWGQGDGRPEVRPLPVAESPGRGGGGPVGHPPLGAEPWDRGPSGGRRDAERVPAAGRYPRGAARLAEPFRPGPGRNPGRGPAAAPDRALDDRGDPPAHRATRATARLGAAAQGPPGAHVAARPGRDGDGRGGGVRAAGQGAGRAAGANRAAPGHPACRGRRRLAAARPLGVHGSGGRLTTASQPGRGSPLHDHEIGGALAPLSHDHEPLAGRRRGSSATRCRGCAGRRGRARAGASRRRGCAGRRGRACTCGPSHRGTGRCARPWRTCRRSIRCAARPGRRRPRLARCRTAG